MQADWNFHLSGSANSFSRSSASKFWFSLALSISLCVVVSHGALSSGEKEVLSTLLSVFPNLGFIPASQFVIDSNIDYGSSWTSNFDALCLGSDGYEYYGLYCGSGRISGLVITSAWGPGVARNFSFLSGLSQLVNITVAVPSSSIVSSMTLALTRTLPIVYLSASVVTLGAGDVLYPEVMTHLTAYFGDSFRLTPFVNLRSLRFYGTNVTNLTSLGQWPISLESVQVDGVVEISSMADVFSELMYLRYLEVSTNVENGVASATFSSNLLEVLKIWVTGNASPFNLVVDSTSLREASIFVGSNGLSLNTPNIKKLALGELFRSFPSGFTSSVLLEELELYNFGVPAEAFPPFEFAQNLAHVSLIAWSALPAQLSSVLCMMASNNSMLASIKIGDLESIVGESYELPSCLRNAPLLKSVYLYGSNSLPISFDSQSILAALNPAIEKLVISDLLNTEINISNFTQYDQLKELYLSDSHLIGETDNNFLLNWPQMEQLAIFSPSINGTIPSVGWQNLRIVQLQSSQEIWTGIDSAPHLSSLLIQSARLKTFPDDIYLKNLLELKTFSLTTRQYANFPTPSFWTGLPKIQDVTMTNNNFSGPIVSSISAPRLLYLNLANNAICGALPDFAVPSSLSVLMLPNNQFSGSIPESWSTNLAIRAMINLSGNQLSGTIPSSFLSKGSTEIAYAQFDDNYFSGPLWNMSQSFPFSSLTISNNNFNVCASDPNIPSTAKIDSCNFEGTLACPNDMTGCLDYWAACTLINCVRRTSERFPPVEACIAPPRASPPVDPPPTAQCPLPGPPGFECIKGQWVSNGSISVPSITLPPNGGVIIVIGNLSSNGSLTFEGIGTSIVVEGCVENVPTQVTIILKGGEKLKTINLLSQKGLNCSTDLSAIPVNLVQDEKNCKQAKTSTKGSTRSSLVVAFDIDSSKCNIKWIILGSVLGGVVILATLSVSLLYAFNSKCRSFIRSCNLKNASRAQGSIRAL